MMGVKVASNEEFVVCGESGDFPQVNVGCRVAINVEYLELAIC